MRDSELTAVNDPSWLLDPPTGPDIPPPISTRPQLLPLASLSWQDFERLCLRLAKEDGEAEHWQLYGTSGQKQGGIDIFVRSAGSSKYVVWQSKRYQKIKPVDIKRAVTKFLSGQWVVKSERFVLCTSASLDDTDLADAIEIQAARLRQSGIVFDVKGVEKISEQLKSYPELVDDFFDRPWTELFCGKATATSLGNRLGRAGFGLFRERLGRLYGAHFAAVDPGVLKASGGLNHPRESLSLAQRYVPVDFVSTSQERPAAIGEQNVEPPESPAEPESRSRRSIRPKTMASPTTRVGMEHWALDAKRSILFGSPGAGKSTLLRFLILDLLSNEPRFPMLKRRWADHLPLLVSFPFWTRLIASGASGAAISVPAVVEAWLETQGEADLARMSRHAFERRQVLLLVDGVDEWTNEESAGTALTLLQTFAETRDMPVVVTSRPHGARLLGTLDASWKRHSLAPLNVPQQIEFAEAWFSFLANQDHQLLGTNSRARAETFVGELQGVPDVAALAGVPLLLGGLMALSREGGSLPRNRFEAYNELADRLIDMQPTARARAALANRPLVVLDRQTRELMFAELAFAIQCRQSTEGRLDAIEKREALNHCKSALQQHLDLPTAEARQQAQQVLEIGTETIGILVEKSPIEIGFLHRAFQELLAARHISGLEPEEQRAIMRQRAGDVQWRDILLFVTQLARRTGDVEQLVEAIEESPTEDHFAWSRTLLLADITFGDVRRSPHLTKRLADTLFDKIETEVDATLRSDILRRAVGGLASQQAALLLRPKLKSWFPRHHGFSCHQALRIISKWKEHEVDAVLWRNLQNDEQEWREAAAEQLAERHAGSSEMLGRVIGLLNQPPNVETAAAAVLLLHLGWGDEQRAKDTIDLAATSSVPDIKFMGIRCRILSGRQSREERDLLRALAEGDDWMFQNPAAELLGAGWPHDAELKKDVLRWFNRSGGRSEVALRVAAEGFGGDDEVAQAIGRAIQHHGFHFYDFWGHLAKNFAGNDELANSVARPKEHRFDQPYYLFHAANISPTSSIRSDLLQALKDAERLRFWAVAALLKHWPQDPDVKKALEAVISWEPADQARISEHLADIFGRGQAVDILKGLLQQARTKRDIYIPNVVQGLLELGILAAEPEIIDEIFVLLADRNPEENNVEGTKFRLLALGPGIARIKQLAIENLRNGSGMLAVIALNFGEDDEVRRRTLEVAAPLPASLRAVITESLKDRSLDDQWALELLEESQFDTDGSIAAGSLVAAAHCRLAGGTVDEPYLERLDREMQALGPQYDRRRFSGFVALATAGHLERAIANLKDQGTGALTLSFGQPINSSEFDARLADVWVRAKTAAEKAGKGDRISLHENDIINRLGPYADTRPELRRYVELNARRALAAPQPNAKSLQFLLQDPANRGDVLDCCIGQLGDGRTWGELSHSLDIADLIARNFAGNGAVHDRVVERLQPHLHSGALAALCDGWQDSLALDEVISTLRTDEDKASEMPIVVALKLIAAKSPPDIVMKNLTDSVATMTGSVWDGIPYWTGTMQRRVREDLELRQMMLAHLRGNPTPGEKASFASLFAMGAGLTAEISEWCVDELAAQRSKQLAESGMDLWLGQHVLLRSRLRELLQSESRLS